MISRAQTTNVLTAAGVFLCFVGPVNGQAVDPKQIVEQFFPVEMSQKATNRQEAGGNPFTPESCFAVFDQLPDGNPRTIVAAYTDGIGGAVRVIQSQSAGSYGVVFQPTGLDFAGSGCNATLVDLDGDGAREVRISFKGGRLWTADWFFRWDGLQLVNLGPTDDGSPAYTAFTSTDLLDLDHDGALEIISLVDPRLVPDDEGFVPNTPREVYKFIGGTYVLQQGLVFYDFYVRETGEPKALTRPINLAQVPTGNHVLKVINGKHDGSRRVSSARIVLNGVEILSPQHFSQQVEFLNIPVTLQRHNTIEVTLAGAPLGEVIITIEDTSAGAPSSNP